MPVDQEPGAPVRLRARAAAAGNGATAASRRAVAALVEAVGALADAAIDRVLLTGERVTLAAEAKRLLAGEADTEALADKVQRVVVLAGTLKCVPNFLVLVFVPEVRSVRRREVEPDPEPEPALSAL